MSAGLWDLRQAAERMGLSRRKARQRLHALHRQHGGLLFRADGRPNTKLWVDPSRLFTVDPNLARRSGDVVTRLDELEREVTGLLAFRDRVAAWWRRQSGPKVRQSRPTARAHR